MLKIDKKEILSTKYKEWLEELEDEKHPKYDSSNFRFYQDIKMSLLYCQNGLCAYSEKSLCELEFIDSKNWNNGKYTRKLSKFDKNIILGDLEHFDESLKPKKAWLWDNLFIVDAHINRNVKKSKSIKNILKPDRIKYSPYQYLDFSYETGLFFPKITLGKNDKKDVEYMINTLGINIYFSDRKKRLKSFLLEYEMRNYLGIEVDAYEYVTAWKMTLKNL